MVSSRMAGANRSLAGAVSSIGSNAWVVTGYRLLMRAQSSYVASLLFWKPRQMTVPSLHQSIAEQATLSCAVAKRFVKRPALLEIAGQILLEHWAQRQLPLQHNPLTLYLISHTEPHVLIRQLPQVLIERYCLGSTLNLNDGEDYLSRYPQQGADAHLEVDLHTVELLVNDCGPLIVEAFLQALVEFWSQSDAHGETPWGWYAAYLQKLMKDAIVVGLNAGRLTPAQAAIASIVPAFPTPQQRSRFDNLQGLSVQQITVDLTSAQLIDADLSSALLVEDFPDPPKAQVAMLFTLVGALAPFDSTQGFLDMLTRHWPRSLLSTPPQARFREPTTSAFEAQAVGFLKQQLRLIEVIAQASRTPEQAAALNAIIDRSTSMLDLCTAQELERQNKIASLLPAWLLDNELAIRYSTLLINQAQSHKAAAGKTWRDGIDTAEAFACKALDARIEHDHPAAGFKASDVIVTNHQVIASASAGQDSVITDGVIKVVNFSLAQLAIDNLGVLAANTVSLHLLSGADLPDWMNEAYVRTLVGELDIGGQYPQTLQRQLLDDPDQSKTRRTLFSAQLKTQLPLLALELHLRDKRISLAACQAVDALFGQSAPGGFVLRPLTLLRASGATADTPLNAWLIEPGDVRQGPCLLYRPLHTEALLEFRDRTALFDALASSGPLQDDLLDRLPEQTRPIYANGGLHEPHIHRFVPGAEFEQLQTPAPASLGTAPAQGSLRELIYQASAEELVERAKRHSTSTAQSRWNAWKQLGWLMFNTLLPLFEGTVAKVTWMIQVLDSAKRLLESDEKDSPAAHRQAFADLLINIAMVLFVHATRRLGIRPEAPTPPTHASVPARTPTAQTLPAPQAELNFSWARPDHRLTAQQKTHLESLASPLSPSTLGSPIADGTLQGLYLHNEQLYFAQGARAYPVQFDAAIDQPRIIAGPWLRRDEALRWTLDLRLRLRGGQPLRNRLKSADLEQSIDNLDQTLRTQQAEALASQQRLQAFARQLTDDTDPRILQGYLGKMETLSQDFERHRETLRERNEKRPLNQYKTLQAKALFERARCQLSMLSTLGKLYKPLRQRFVQSVRETDGVLPEPGSSKHSMQVDLLDQIELLLGKLISHTETLSATREQLHKLSSIRQPTIQMMELSLNEPAVGPASRLYWYTLRSEVLSNRLRLVEAGEDASESDYWLEHSWRNIEQGMLQRMNLQALSRDQAEVHARVLDNIQRHFSTALRQLGNLKNLVPGQQAADSLVSRLETDLTLMLKETRADLDEYPQPLLERSSLRQLHRQVPGLIETRDEGVLLGQQRRDSEGIVDIHNPQDDSIRASYREDPLTGTWEPISPEQALPPQVTDADLSALLREGMRLAALARQDIQRLKNQGRSTYLPIEIEEIADRRRLALTAQRQAIERTLTRDNQTDQAAGNTDAALQIKQLDEVAGELLHTGEQLRIEAALTQAPSMRELEYLLGKGQVKLKRLVKRKPLASTRGWAQEYLDEYVVLHANKPLWYAHFHYAAENTPVDDFKAAHLKLASQRYDRGQFVEGNKVVHRGPISLAAARQWFFKE